MSAGTQIAWHCPSGQHLASPPYPLATICTPASQFKSGGVPATSLGPGGKQTPQGKRPLTTRPLCPSFLRRRRSTCLGLSDSPACVHWARGSRWADAVAFHLRSAEREGEDRKMLIRKAEQCQLRLNQRSPPVPHVFVLLLKILFKQKFPQQKSFNSTAPALTR